MPIPYYDHLLNARAKILNRVRVALSEVKKLQLCYSQEVRDPDGNGKPRYIFKCYTQKSDPQEPEQKLTVLNRIFNPAEAGLNITYPACYCIHDPEVVADVSLYGNRIQRFFPIVIIGWLSNRSIKQVFENGLPIHSDDVYIPDIYRDSRESLRRWYIGDAYIDMITAALTMPANIEYFKYPLSLIQSADERHVLEPVTGFAIERIGPSIVDEYPYKQEYTFFSLSFQTSFNQNTYDPRHYCEFADIDNIIIVDTETKALEIKNEQIICQ